MLLESTNATRERTTATIAMISPSSSDGLQSVFPYTITDVRMPRTTPRAPMARSCQGEDCVLPSPVTLACAVQRPAFLVRPPERSFDRGRFETRVCGCGHMPSLPATYRLDRLVAPTHCGFDLEGVASA